jgi:hypothetical protein
MGYDASQAMGYGANLHVLSALGNRA